MPTTLMVVGGIWAALGAANLATIVWRGTDSGIAALGLVVNVVLFIIPGLLLLAVGQHLRRKDVPPE
jgi:hypothetical protein